jgi:macrolide-specific efflux system membrane fusion protein
MRKPKRRFWLIALIIVVVAAAAVTAALLLLDRGKSDGVHYLTSTAAKGTIAQTVQADFTLTNAKNAMTISLSGVGSSASTASASSTNAGTTDSAFTADSIVTHQTFATAPITVDRAIVADDTASPAPAPTITAMIPTSGPTGSSVTLVGSGFTGATTVSFNGRAARFTVNSDTQLTATVPFRATSGPLTVATPVGRATSAASFTVTAKPRPTPTPSPSRSADSGASGGSSFSSRSSAGTSSSGSGSTTSSTSSAASSGTSGVVTGIALAAGKTPRTLERLLSISGTPVYAFVSSTPLYTTLSTSLSTGAQRSNVAALQHALKDDGYFTGTINGDFGTTTQTALEDWQGAHGLTKTGEITTSQFVWVPKGTTIESWNVTLGSRVSSSTALATADSPRDLVAEAQVSQADISSLKFGQKAALTIDGETSDPFTGTITSIASQPASSGSSSGSSSTVEYTVDLAPHDLPSLAKSGMTGSLTVTIASRSNVLVVPTSAVSGTSSASFVRVMQNGTPSYRQVTTGMATSSLTQITSGLVAGEVVVTGTYTNSATTNASTTTGSGFGGLGGFSGGGGFIRRSSGGTSSSGSGQ